MPDLSIPDLVGGGWRSFPFVPFREGVEIHRLVDGGSDAPSVALLKYHPGARVPRHLHTGLETILVLAGSQSDHAGTYGAGSLVVNAAGSIHRVWSEQGCVVLIQWERPVVILEEDQ